MPAIPFLDDPQAVPDNERLLRRIRPHDMKRQHDGVARPNSAAFQLQRLDQCLEEGYPGRLLSLASWSILEQNGFGPEKLVESFADYLICSLLARDLREIGYGLDLRGPQAEPWHVCAFWIADPHGTSDAPKPAKRRAALAATWTTPPTA